MNYASPKVAAQQCFERDGIAHGDRLSGNGDQFLVAKVGEVTGERLAHGADLRSEDALREEQK
jgi:hypothetical protein